MIVKKKGDRFTEKDTIGGEGVIIFGRKKRVKNGKRLPKRGPKISLTRHSGGKAGENPGGGGKLKKKEKGG